MKTDIPEWLQEGAWDTFNDKTRYKWKRRQLLFCLNFILGICMAVFYYSDLVLLKPFIGRFFTLVAISLVVLSPLLFLFKYQCSILEEWKRKKIEITEHWQKVYLRLKIKELYMNIPQDRVKQYLLQMLKMNI
jgi:hypothetical protein